jgi:hypothetical protein
MADSKARKLANIVDTSGNIVSPNAASNATNLGIKDLNGVDIAQKVRTTISANITTNTLAGSLASINSGVNCATALANGYKNSVYGPNGSSPTYVDANGMTQTQPYSIPAPPDGNWWDWDSKGFIGTPTSNCQNNGSYDGRGGYSASLQATGEFNTLVYGSYTSVDELGGTYQYRTVSNCNCSYAFNCRTNCNCNCACACAC